MAASSLTSQQASSFIESLAPLFSLYGLEADRDNVTALLHNVSASKALDAAVTEKLMTVGLPASPENVKKLSVDSTAPLPGDFLILDQVKSMRPEYLVGTWFNTQNTPFNINIELDWVNRMTGGNCSMPSPMGVLLFGSTGEHIWEFISEIYIHPTAIMPFRQRRDGWIQAPDGYSSKLWKQLEPDSLLNFIDRMIQARGSRTLVMLQGGMGGWATFERVTNSDVTLGAAMQLFKFSGPHYWARSDGKVVMKLKDGGRDTLKDLSNFPSGRTLVTDKNKFPSCIPA